MVEKDMNCIKLCLTTEELLAQLAEECAELSQAALKLIRARTGGNPTPKTISECEESLAEEIADVSICVRLVMDVCCMDRARTEAVLKQKVARWVKRLEE